MKSFTKEHIEKILKDFTQLTKYLTEDQEKHLHSLYIGVDTSGNYYVLPDEYMSVSSDGLVSDIPDIASSYGIIGYIMFGEEDSTFIDEGPRRRIKVLYIFSHGLSFTKRFERVKKGKKIKLKERPDISGFYDNELGKLDKPKQLSLIEKIQETRKAYPISHTYKIGDITLSKIKEKK